MEMKPPADTEAFESPPPAKGGSAGFYVPETNPAPQPPDQQLEQALASLREYARRCADLYHEAPLAYFTLTEEGIIEDVNRRGCELLGLERHELVGCRLAQWVAVADGEIFAQYCRKPATKPPRELRLRRRGHEIFYARLELRPLGTGHKLATITEISTAAREGCDATGGDAAEVKKRNEQLRRLMLDLTQTEQRERRRLAQFLHDQLQQLLIGASMSVQVLKLRQIEESSQRLLDKVDGALQEAISATRTMTTELCPVILHEAGLKPALAWLADQMMRKYGVHVGLDLDGLVDPMDDQLRPLLFESARELLFNIVKHGQTKKAWLRGGREADGRASLVVADDGAGFDPVAIEQHISAAGFGLYHIRQRLELLDGRMEIDSAPGCGCRVKLTGPSPQPTRLERAIRLLLVDDQKIVREGLARLLAEQPDLVVAAEAGDGQAALDLADAIPIDVVLMDINMPRMNGVEATHRLHERHPELPIIGLSIYEEQQMEAKMLAAGAAFYLSKGGPVEDLLAAIRRASRCGRAHPSA